MSVVDAIRRRWLHFMGRDQVNTDEAQRAALESELEFQMTLQEMRKRRDVFDTRPPPPIPSEPPGIALDALRDRLDADDRLMREALDDEAD